MEGMYCECRKAQVAQLVEERLCSQATMPLPIDRILTALRSHNARCLSAFVPLRYPPFPVRNLVGSFSFTLGMQQVCSFCFDFYVLYSGLYFF